MLTLPPIAPVQTQTLNPTLPTSVLVAAVPVAQAATYRPTQGPDREKHKLRDQPNRERGRRENHPNKQEHLAAQEHGRAMNTDFMA